MSATRPASPAPAAVRAARDAARPSHLSAVGRWSDWPRPVPGAPGHAAAPPTTNPTPAVRGAHSNMTQPMTAHLATDHPYDMFPRDAVDPMRGEPPPHRYDMPDVLGRSPAMHEVLRTVCTVARCKTTVLITGESGTGKEVIAKALHARSPRADGPLVTINCAAIPEALLESELFGHERGAFTDAHQRKRGQFELAHGGTLFLDEIGELGAAMQAKLLRVLEREEFLRVGGTSPIAVDVRIVAATNRHLEDAVRDGMFRADLYYRLNVVRVGLPPLRERGDDLLLLLEHFLRAKAHALRVPEKRMTPEALEILREYTWPGNVRELENVVERLLVLVEHDVIDVGDLPDHVRRHEILACDAKDLVLSGRRSLSQVVDEFERDIIMAALERTRFNQTKAALMLGTTRRILRYRMAQLGIPGSRE
jgi:transcriptional regulator with PAS, ATPase and Fis domain